MKAKVFMMTMMTMMTAILMGCQGCPDSKPQINQADAVLAYEHFYELALEAFEDTTLLNDLGFLGQLETAKAEIDSVLHFQVLTWPAICDQRDQLSDAIRSFAHEHPDAGIEKYIKKYTDYDWENLEGWTYAY